jgi:hypothetical protein
MIYSHITGGLGNQLFQIFATMAYAIRHNQAFAFLRGEEHGPRRTHWNDFLSDLAPFTVSNIPQITYNENQYGFDYHEIPYLGECGCIRGYFQSELYFRDHFDLICQNIGLRERQEEIKSRCSEYFIRPGTYISMHFRLGDYKNNPYHLVISYEYFGRALSNICSRIRQYENMNILYFCELDDNDTVKCMVDRLGAEFPGLTFQKVTDNFQNWEQMLLMSLCHHHIIANSSFSWWGAYFNSRSDKIVCYPSVWFGPSFAHLSTKDICPRGWTNIDV